jgi:predicted small metal-binding protein/anti-sigma regulatory factor (Ser/Thr protein kinase)
VKRFVCRDIIPGCDHVVTGANDQSVLDQVITHVAVDHGLVKPPLALVELVVATTRTLADVRPRGHLRLVGAGATHRPANGSNPIRDDVGRGGDEHPGSDQHGAGGCPPAGVLTIPVRRTSGSKVRHWRDSSVHSAPEPHERYRHECQLYRGIDEFLVAIVPFIQDGLERGQQVMVAVAEPRLQAVRDALGADANLVVFADMAKLGRNPALIIPAWREFAAAANGRPIRGVGEPIWAGRSDAEIVECQLHEALLNLAVSEQTPLWLLCPYDIESLDDALIVEALRSHPFVVESDTDAGNRHFGGAAHARSLFAATLPQPVVPTTAVHFDDDRHGEAAAQIQRFATGAGIPAQRSAKLVSAIDELATAGWRDAGGVQIRLWLSEDVMVCEVDDRGLVDDPLIGRASSLRPQSRERGIRLANELCDLVQVRSNASGTTVRVHSLL